MGDMSDYYLDQDMARMWEEHEKDEYYGRYHYKDILSDYLKGKLYWATKDNGDILIQDMSDSHILNSIKYIDNKHSDRTVMQELKDILIMEKNKRKI